MKIMLFLAGAVLLAVVNGCAPQPSAQGGASSQAGGAIVGQGSSSQPASQKLQPNDYRLIISDPGPF